MVDDEQFFLLVCGGRKFSDHDQLFTVLDLILVDHPRMSVIHGAAEGADTLAGEWCAKRGIIAYSFPAKWKQDGIYSAGPIRNERMLRERKPSSCVAFYGGSGTADMVRRCRKAGVPVQIIKKRKEDQNAP